MRFISNVCTITLKTKKIQMKEGKKMEEYKNINDIINNVNDNKFDELEKNIDTYYNITNFEF